MSPNFSPLGKSVDGVYYEIDTDKSRLDTIFIHDFLASSPLGGRYSARGDQAGDQALDGIWSLPRWAPGRFCPRRDRPRDLRLSRRCFRRDGGAWTGTRSHGLSKPSWRIPTCGDCRPLAFGDARCPGALSSLRLHRAAPAVFFSGTKRSHGLSNGSYQVMARGARTALEHAGFEWESPARHKLLVEHNLFGIRIQ